MKKEIQIYGRSREKFEKLFPQAIFEGYECNIRYAYYTIKGMSSKSILGICDHNKISVINIIEK